MKGQYLAIESVLTFGMGIILALGVITIFNSYKEDVVQSTTEKDVISVRADVQNGLKIAESFDSGFIELDLPTDLEGNDYRVGINEELRIISQDVNRSYSLKGINEKIKLSGTVEGGENLRIYKRENVITIREG